MAFEQWLRHVFIPRVEETLAAGPLAVGQRRLRAGDARMEDVERMARGGWADRCARALRRAVRQSPAGLIPYTSRPACPNCPKVCRQCRNRPDGSSTAPVRAVLVAIQLPDVDDDAFAASIAELGRLGRTLGVEMVATLTQRRRTLDPGTVVGSGKLDELKAMTVDAVLVDHDITPSQARNLEKATGVEVLDRTAVILEIFRRHARSRAAKAQVEIVRLQYLVPRLREQGKGQDRQRGGIGGKGAGESSLELDRRKIRDRIAELTRELDGAGGGAADAAGAPPRHVPRRAGRLHQRGQVDADARADRQRGLRRRQAVRDAGHHRAAAAPGDAAARAGVGHGRVHRQAAARPGGVVQEHARRGAGGRTARAGGRRVGAQLRAPAGGDDRGAGRDRRDRRAAPAGVQQDRLRRRRGRPGEGRRPRCSNAGPTRSSSRRAAPPTSSACATG